MSSTEKRNRRKLRELFRISFLIGVNITSPSSFKDSLKILNIFLLVTSSIGLYGNWSLIKRHFKTIIFITESVCTAFQTIISMIKMMYLLFVQKKFYQLLQVALTHELIEKIEIFQENFAFNAQLRNDVNEVLENTWKNIRRQLVFYTCCCMTIISFYFFNAIFMNAYRERVGEQNSTVELPIPAVFPMWEKYGTKFPYYQLQLFFVGSSVYIAGLCAVSFDGTFIVLTMHGVALFRVLKKLISYSTSEAVPEHQRVTYLRYCIYHYERTYSYCLNINHGFKHISITQFILSLLVLGMVLFQASVGLRSDLKTFIRMVLYMSAAGYEVVIYCFNGQLLTSESETLPLAWYDCEWYKESKEFKELVLMMILRTNRAFYMNVSWFTTMMSPTFLVMVRTSGSYFLLLRNLAE